MKTEVHYMTKNVYQEKLTFCYDSPHHYFREGDIEWIVLFGDLFFRNRSKGDCWKPCIVSDN